MEHPVYAQKKQEKIIANKKIQVNTASKLRDVREATDHWV